MRRTLRKLVSALDRASADLTIDNTLLETALIKLDPMLSLRTVRARVVSVIHETADTQTYWLRPNARFRGYRPGSFVTLQLAIDGERLQRSYSISSAPRNDGLFSITVKRVAGGRVSNWLADTLRPGHVLELSAAQGRFVLPEVLPEKLLMLSAGSGITPVMSMLRHLVASGAQREIKFLHFARTPGDIIFRDELARVAASYPHVHIVHCVESAAGEAWKSAEGRFSQALLAQVAPEFRSLDTFVCGPAGFMGAVLATFEQSGADMSKVRYERFNSAFDPSEFLQHAHLIRFVRSGAESVGNRPRTILEEAERAGLSVQAGCRAGNCGTCRSKKHSGVVVDITTGSQSQLGEEFIFPCVSIARGTVEIDL